METAARTSSVGVSGLPSRLAFAYSRPTDVGCRGADLVDRIRRLVPADFSASHSNCSTHRGLFRLILSIRRMGRLTGVDPFSQAPTMSVPRIAQPAEQGGELRRGEARQRSFPFLGGSRHEQDKISAAAGRDETAGAHSGQLQDSPPAPERLCLSGAWYMALSRVAWSHQWADPGRLAGKGSGGTCRN
jgi:hypothetical protein